MAHTPGPWTVERIDYSKRLDVSFEIKAGRELVAQTIMREIATEPARIATDEANTRLIAAAPELLAALQAATGYLENARIDLETGAPKTTALATVKGGLYVVRAAIAKAEGNS